MRITHLVLLLVVSGLVLAGCASGRQEPSSPAIAAPTPSTPSAGPGRWPTEWPVPPSPSATPGSAPAGPTAPGREAGIPDPLAPIHPSTNTVATSTTAGWTTYRSINGIRGLAFAADGTLWAGTSGGLVHWNLDAETYTRYPIMARALAIAPDGTLWLALQEGLCHFDGTSCELYSTADGLLGGDVQAVAVAADGVVWVGSGQGVSRFDGDSWRSYPSPVTTYDLAVTSQGEVWAATAGGIGRYLPTEDAWITYTEDHGLPTSSAQVIATGPDNEVWAYLVWEGVYRFDGARWQKVEGTGPSVFDITFAADGTPWVATTGGMHYPGGSLSYHDGEQWIDVASDQTLHSFTAATLGSGGVVAASTQLGLGLYEGGEWRLLRDGPTTDIVTSVAVTPDGAAWFGFGDHSASTPGWGLSRFDGQEWDYFLADAEVNVLAVGPDGTLWAGVGCSAQRFDGVSWEPVARCEDLPAGGILDIDFGPDGAVWVASGFGLARFDGELWTVYDRAIHSLVAAPDGSLWMNGWEGTHDSFFVAHVEGETWTTYRAADSFPGGFLVQAVTSDGRVWGIAPEGRFVSFDGRSWTDGASWTFPHPPGGVSLDNVTRLALAPDGALWMVVDSILARFEPESSPDEAWTLYPRDSGLPESLSPALAFGPGGEIWLGATRFQPAPAGGAGIPIGPP